MNDQMLFLTIIMGYLGILGGSIYIIKRTIPKIIQQALNVVAEEIEPIITTAKKGFGLAGTLSGIKRAEAATIDKFNTNIGAVVPSLGIVGEKLGMEPTEMLSLLQDPIVGPWIQKFLGGALGSKKEESGYGGKM